MLFRSAATTSEDRASARACQDGFEANLVETLDAFNAGATSTTGDDPMGRGVPGTTAYESSIAWWQFAFAYLGGAAPPAEDLEFPNPLTQPFWTAGDDGSQTPLYVRPLNFGSIDTKFGPKCDRDMRVVGTENVFAAGNAAASPFGQTYAAPGNTLGFALVSGYVAGRRAAGRRENEITYDGVPKPVAAGYRKLPESGAHQVLHLSDLGRRHRLAVGEVKAQFVRTADGAALVDRVPDKHLAQRPVDQVRRGVVGRNERPPLIVHGQLRGLDPIPRRAQLGLERGDALLRRPDRRRLVLAVHRAPARYLLIDFLVLLLLLRLPTSGIRLLFFQLMLQR